MQLYLTVGVPLITWIWADSSAPPLSLLPHKMQLMTGGSQALMYRPPPLSSAAFPLKVQLVSVALVLDIVAIAPPYWAELPPKVQLVTAGVLPPSL